MIPSLERCGRSVVWHSHLPAVEQLEDEWQFHPESGQAFCLSGAGRTCWPDVLSQGGFQP